MSDVLNSTTVFHLSESMGKNMQGKLGSQDVGKVHVDRKQLCFLLDSPQSVQCFQNPPLLHRRVLQFSADTAYFMGTKPSSLPPQAKGCPIKVAPNIKYYSGPSFQCASDQQAIH